MFYILIFFLGTFHTEPPSLNIKTDQLEFIKSTKSSNELEFGSSNPILTTSPEHVNTDKDLSLSSDLHNIVKLESNTGIYVLLFIFCLLLKQLSCRSSLLMFKNFCFSLLELLFNF